MRAYLCAALLGAATLSANPAVAADDFGVPAGYRLSIETAETCHKAMLAVMNAARSDAKLKGELAAFGADEEDGPDIMTVDLMTARMEKLSPTASRMLADKDCGPRKLWTSTMATAEAGLWMVGRQMDASMEIPAGAQENIDILKQHQARFEKIGQEQAAASAALGLD